MAMSDKVMARRCRAVIVTKEGEKITTRWRPYKTAEELDADEFSPLHYALKAADRYAKRKKFTGYRVDAQFVHPRGEGDYR